MSITIDLVGVFPDGSPQSSAVPTNPRTTLRLIRGMTHLIRLTALRPPNSPFDIDIAGGDSVILVARQKTLPRSGRLFTLTAVAAGPLNRVDFALPAATTREIQISQAVYDVIYTAAAGDLCPLIPLSPLILGGTAGGLP